MKMFVTPAKAGVQCLATRRTTMDKNFCVYILASGRNGTLYVGITSDLPKRIWEHKEKVLDGFTKRYGVDRLVWFEPHPDAESAISREKQIKEWKRRWKLDLIEKANPYWRDLYGQIVQDDTGFRLSPE